MEKHRNPDGTYDGLGVLGEMSGLPRKVMLDLAEQVKANHAKLNACPAHDFEVIDPMARRKRYRCRHCGGEVDFHAWFWHEQGRRPSPSS